MLGQHKEYNKVRGVLGQPATGIYVAGCPTPIAPEKATLPLLCGDCEGRFGVWEGTVSTKLFKPLFAWFLQKAVELKAVAPKVEAPKLWEKISMADDTEHHYRKFALSVLWRTVILQMGSFEDIEGCRSVLLGKSHDVSRVRIQCDYDLMENPNLTLDELSLGTTMIANRTPDSKFLTFLGPLCVTLSETSEPVDQLIPRFDPNFRRYKLLMLEKGGWDVSKYSKEPISRIQVKVMLPNGMVFDEGGLFEDQPLATNERWFFTENSTYSPLAQRAVRLMSEEGEVALVFATTIVEKVKFDQKVKTNQAIKEKQKVRCCFVLFPLREAAYICSSFECNDDGSIDWDRDLKKEVFEGLDEADKSNLLIKGKYWMDVLRHILEKTWQDYAQKSAAKPEPTRARA
ncbi:hypothetical protein BASA81_000336 [Batrachochytrium salamandrivorans]|nr:hypothetical protein BASA81_000336 [Batrachochytrium salamandrivorans]